MAWSKKFRNVAVVNNNEEYRVGDLDSTETYNVPINNTQYLYNILNNNFVSNIEIIDQETDTPKLKFTFLAPQENNTDARVSKTVSIALSDLNGVKTQELLDYVKKDVLAQYARFRINYYAGDEMYISASNPNTETQASKVSLKKTYVTLASYDDSSNNKYNEYFTISNTYNPELHVVKKDSEGNLKGTSYYWDENGDFYYYENGTNKHFAKLDELTEGDDKNLYHLGAYDSILHHGDGTVTITRQTGYVTPKELVNLNWQVGSNENYNYVTEYSIRGSILPQDVSTIICANFPICSWNATSGEGKKLTHAYGLRFYDFSKTFNSVEDYRNLILENNIEVQYRLETPYYEKVIEGRPLNTLDQNGSQWLRNEWEKGLNLANLPDRIGRWWVTTQDDITNVINRLPNGVYTISSDFAPLSIDSGYNVQDCFFWLQIFGGQYTGDGVHTTIDGFTALYQIKRGSLTFTKENYTNYEFRLWGFGNHNGGNHGQGRCSNIMLIEGTNDYPYQPYYGSIVHKSDIDVINKRLDELGFKDGTADITFIGCSYSYGKLIKTGKYAMINIGVSTSSNPFKLILPNAFKFIIDSSFTRKDFTLEGLYNRHYTQGLCNIVSIDGAVDNTTLTFRGSTNITVNIIGWWKIGED